MKKIEFLTPPSDDEWQVNVAGFGYLPLMNSSDIKLVDGKMCVTASHNMFDAQAYQYGSGQNEVSKCAKWVQLFNDLDFCVVVRVNSKVYGPDVRDGYIGVFHMEAKDISEQGYSCDLVARLRDGTPSYNEQFITHLKSS